MIKKCSTARFLLYCQADRMVDQKRKAQTSVHLRYLHTTDPALVVQLTPGTGSGRNDNPG